jgi:hypothetical protein
MSARSFTDAAARRAARDRWGLPKCVYAAAHHAEPTEVLATDDGFDTVRLLVVETERDYIAAIARTAGLPEDIDYEDLLLWIAERAGSAGSVTPERGEQRG